MRPERCSDVNNRARLFCFLVVFATVVHCNVRILQTVSDGRYRGDCMDDETRCIAVSVVAWKTSCGLDPTSCDVRRRRRSAQRVYIITTVRRYNPYARVVRAYGRDIRNDDDDVNDAVPMYVRSSSGSKNSTGTRDVRRRLRQRCSVKGIPKSAVRLSYYYNVLYIHTHVYPTDNTWTAKRRYILPFDSLGFFFCAYFGRFLIITNYFTCLAYVGRILHDVSIPFKIK